MSRPALIGAVLLAASGCGAPDAPAEDGGIVLDEPLKGSALKAFRVSGGAFLPDSGWKITGLKDHVLWHLPTIGKGAVEFKIRGLSPNESRPGMAGKNEIFHMYDWKAGNADDVYAPPDRGPGGYRNNPFKHFIRKTGCLDTRPGKTDSLELLLKIGNRHEEPDSAVLSWNPASTYTFRVEWGPDGAGNLELKTYRDGALLYTMRQPGEWRPQGHALRIGASNRGAKDEEAPLDAVFSHVRVWDLGTGGRR